jgi:hypothetical protein
MSDFIFDNRKPMARGWNESKLFRGKLLTDKKIREYEAKGFYETGFKMTRRDATKAKREWLLKNGI